MVRRVILSIFLVVLVLAGIAYLLPGEVNVQRATSVKATPDELYPLISDFRRFNQWSPWARQDPKMQIIFRGPDAGVGAKMNWISTQVGSGAQEIIEAVPPTLVRTKLDLSGAIAFSSIVLSPEPGGTTKVTWTFKSELGNNPVARYMGLLYPGWIRKDYDDGLAALKRLAETGTSGLPVAGSPAPGDQLDQTGLPPDVQKALNDKEPQPSPVPSNSDVLQDPEVIRVEAQPILYVSTKAKVGDQAETSKALNDAYVAIIEYIQKHTLDVSGAPLAISSSFDPQGDWVFDAAIPLASMPTGLPEEGIVKLGETPAGQALKAVHKGPYSTMHETYEKLRAKIREKGLKEGPRFWEEYVTDPGETDEAELLTNIYILVE